MDQLIDETTRGFASETWRVHCEKSHGPDRPNCSTGGESSSVLAGVGES